MYIPHTDQSSARCHHLNHLSARHTNPNTTTMPISTSKTKSAPPASASTQVTGNPFDDKYGKEGASHPWWSPITWYKIFLASIMVVRIVATVVLIDEMLPKSWTAESRRRLIAEIKLIIKEILHWVIVAILKFTLFVIALIAAVLIYKYYDHIIAELIHQHIYSSLRHR